MQYRFVVAPDAQLFSDDYWVFVHFLDSDGELMWTDDHQPPTPTKAWKPGSTIEYTRTMFVPKFPYVGEAHVEVGLFSPKTSVRLPLAGQTSGQRSYQVATFNMRLQSDNLFIVFKDGWHDTETSDEAGLEWQWSRKEGTLSFRNPKRDATVLLQLDQPIAAAFPEPQHVAVRLGSTVLDQFALPPGMRELRRFNVSAEQLGNADTVELVVAVDKTFVPASVAALRSNDVRELGVRVFRAYIEPR
jgi:hypothetical protein